MLTISQKDLSQALKIGPRTINKMFKPFSKGRYSKSHVLTKLRTMYRGVGFKAVEVPELLTAEQYGRLVGRSKHTVLRWARLKQLPHYQLGSHGVRVWLDDVENLSAIKEGGCCR